MRILSCENYQEMSRKAAGLVVEELSKKPELLLSAATGNSPAGLYQELGRQYAKNPSGFDRLRILKLDEWGGLPHKHPVTCEYFIAKYLLEPLGIARERYFTFSSDPEDPLEECRIFRKSLKKEGPIDVCILGLGMNGHLGLNEPKSELEPYFHVAELAEKSLSHEMIASLEVKPGYGLTLGMKDILSSRKIVLLVTGKGKKEIYAKLMEGKISSSLPASFLWTHGHVSCFVDEAALSSHSLPAR